VTYAARLTELTALGPVVCVGADPHPEILSAWGESDSAAGLGAWARRLVSVVTAAGVSVVKPQVAFFERHGIAGMTVLSELLGDLRTAGQIVIADAKRGDIGSTMEGYADAWLRPGSDFEVDALTLVAYQGIGALAPALERALDHSKGIFVLAATSNEEAWQTQSAVRWDGLTVAAGVMRDLTDWGRANAPSADGTLGAVVGATVDQSGLGLDLASHPTMAILAPGYGAQGAKLADAKRHFPHSQHLLAVSARALLGGGPEGFHSRYARALEEVRSR